MPHLASDNDGTIYLVDDDGDPWPIQADEDGYYVEDEDGEFHELDTAAIEEALSGDEDESPTQDDSLTPQEAWDGWAGRQLGALDKRLGRTLTDKEVRKLYDRATSHNEPNPSFDKLFDEEFPGRRNLGRADDDERQAVMAEIVEDGQAEGQGAQDQGESEQLEAEDATA
jgi:hypothetical protein